MSTGLAWYKQPSKRKELGTGSGRLKYILAERYTEHDGSLGSKFTIGSSEEPFIAGLVAAGVEDADKLLEHLREHKVLDVEIA